MKGVYPHANTVVSIGDSMLLKKLEYEILLNADGLAATLRELNGINYFHSYRQADLDSYGAMLDGLMKATFTQMREISPVELIWRIFSLYYDVHNIKLAAKERFLRRRLDHYFLDYGGYPPSAIRSATVRESDDILDNKILTGGLFEAIRSKDMYDIDFILDRTYFKALKDYAAQFGLPGIAAFVTERIDLYNVSAFFQHRAAGSPEGYFEKAFSGEGSRPYEEWQRYIGGAPEEILQFELWQKYEPVWKNAEDRRRLFSEFDVLRDNYLIARTKACKLMAFGIEPICAYYFNKLMEIKNVRILLAGKEHGYAAEEITRRMRDTYEL